MFCTCLFKDTCRLVTKHGILLGFRDLEFIYNQYSVGVLLYCEQFACMLLLLYQMIHIVFASSDLRYTMSCIIRQTIADILLQNEAKMHANNSISHG